jgi:hypothetical protein
MHRARVVRRNGFLLLGAAALGLLGFAARADESGAPARATSSRRADTSDDAFRLRPSHRAVISSTPRPQAASAANASTTPLGSAPILSFASYFGRTVNDQVKSIALGPDGSAYVAGVTGSLNAGTVPGQAFVARVAPDGASLLYMVDLGGSAHTEARAIAVDGFGNAYITGVTFASDFPVHNALQSSCSLNSKAACSGDAFLTKLNPDGSIAFSTYLGGSGEDAANAIALDAAGNIYIAGSTASTDFPVFKPLQATSGGQGDAFIAKFSADGAHVLYATYFGGSAADEARGLALDSLGNIYVTGQTFSHDFPLAKAFQPSCGLNAKKECPGTGFVAKLSSDGTSLTYSTYFGGTGGEAANAIAVDASGSAYITGATTSVDFPVAKAFQSVAHGGSDAFVSKLSPDGSSLAYSTYFGGKADDSGFAIAIDKSGNTYVSGVTDSPDVPLFTPVQAACAKDGNGACTQDAFVAVLDPTGARLEFATYLGGTGSDEGRGIAVDPQGAVLLAGATTSVDFPAAKRVLLAAPVTATHSALSTQSSLLSTGTPGGGLVAKFTGLSVVGGTGGANKIQANSPTVCPANTTNWLGGTGNWSNAAMWSTGVVPNSTSVNVCIDDGNAIASVVTLDISVNVGTLTIDSDDTLIVADNIDFFLNGNVSNAGQIQMNSIGSLVRLRLSANVQLSGGGTVTLSNTAHNLNTIIRGEGGGGTTLTNVDNTIQGEGQIGNGTGMLVTNQAAGTINANSKSQALLLNSGTVTNLGALEATGGGLLQIPAVLVVNTGTTIQANGAGSAVQLLNNSTIQGGTLAAANGGAMGGVSGNNTTLDGKTTGAVTIVGTFNVPDNVDLFLSGTLNNTGAIQMNSAGNLVRLRLQTTGVQLTGGGTITLSNTAHNLNAIIRGEGGGTTTLTNVDNIIQGEGQIGNGTGMLVTNQAGGTIDANSISQALLLNSGTVTNLGTLEATGGGFLQIPAVLVVNTGRTIQSSGTGSALQLLNSSTIQGGTLATANGGVMGVVSGNSSTLDGATSGAVTLAGTFTVPDNVDLFLSGTLNNTGTIQMNSAGNLVRLRLQTTGVQLMGGGTITLSNTAHNLNTIIRGEGGGSTTLTNADNTIQGEGQIGNGTGMLVTNQAAGTINANSKNQALLLNSGTFTNLGALEATNGAFLQIPTSVVDTGSTIEANGTGSAVQLLNNSTIQGGTLTAANGGAVGIVSGNTSTLDGKTTGAVTIVGAFTVPDNSDLFVNGTLNNTGAIQINSIGDLARIRINPNMTLMGGGTVTLSNTAHNGNAIIRGEGGGSSTLTNVDNTIQGEGQLGNSTGMVVVNQATIDANVAKQALLLNGGLVTNAGGLLEAVSGGILQVGTVGITINNKSGTIQDNGAGSLVQLFNGTTIQGGTLNTLNGGVLGVAAGNTITLDGTAQGSITNAGTFTVADNADLFVTGTLNNTGALLLNSAGNLCRIRINTGLTLTGGGTVTLANSNHNGNASIRVEAAGVTLTNANNTIQGEGQIGNGTNLALLNQSTINANVSGQALLFNGTGLLTNAGVLEAVGGGILQVGTVGIVINNKTGTIKDDGTGSAVQLFNGTTIQGGTLTTANGGVLGVAGGNTITLDGTAQGAITNAGTFTVADNADLFAMGTLNNTGTLLLNSLGNLSRLRLNASLTITGGGTVTLANSNHNGNTIIRGEAAGIILTNSNNTIQGEGQIGNSTNLAVINQSTIVANVPKQSLLFNGTGVVSNAGGLLDAVGGGILQVGTVGIVINNNAGTIKDDGAGSAVQLFNGTTIQGGTLATANGGVLGVAAGQTITLDGTTQGAITNAGTFTVADNADLFAMGTLNNTGTLLLNSAGNLARLRMPANLTITGGGTVTLANSAHNGNAIIRAEAAFTLTNANDTIQGEGQIGNGTALVVANQSTIVANVSKQSLLFNGTGVVSNAGLLDAVGGGILQVGTVAITLNNKGGVIKDDGAGSAVQLFNGTTIQGGTLTTANGGVLGVPGGQTITLDGTAQGPLTNAGTFTVADNADLFATGVLNNTGTLLLNSTGNLSRLRLNSNLQLMGAGTVTLANSAHNGNAIIRAEASGVTLTNFDNTVQGEGQIGNGTGLVLTNQGTINSNVANQSISINASGAVSNAGLLEASSGSTLQLSNAALNNAGGILKIDGTLITPAGFSPTGGTLDGGGNISGSLVSGGVLQPGDAPAPGIFTINGSGAGNYTQASGGAFSVPIGGTTAGTQFSQLGLSGTAMLAGALNVSLINGFTPAVGNQFTILTAASVTGQFATTNFPSLPAGLIWNITYNPTSVQLSIAQAQAGVSLSPSPANFGNQRVNTMSSPFTVTLTNNGTGALTLAATNAVQIGGANGKDFALASGTTCTNGATVANGATCLILLTFKPAAAGARTATITVTDNANPTTQTVTLNGIGTAPLASPSPSPLVFAAQPIGMTSAPLTLSVTNTGTDTLNFAAGVNPLAISGKNAADFAIVPSGTTCTSGAQVMPDASCAVAVTFTATIAGSETAVLTITDDSGAVVGSTQSVPLMGTGNGPAVTLNPTSAAFPATPLNTASAPLTITLTNSGTATLSITANVSITGANAGDFAVAQGTTCTVETNLQAGTSCAIVFTFTPSANGARNAIATVTDNATPGTQTIALSGATPSAVSLSTTALNFANQGVGNASPAQSVILTNTGGAPLTFTSAPTITGTNATDFSVATTSTCTTATPVAPSGTCTINVIFTPTATGARGPATLTIFDGAVATAPVTQTVTLTGTGVTFSISGPPAPIVVQPGQLATFPITLTPGPNGFPGPVTFCATAVAPATCFPLGVAAEFPQPMQTPNGNSVTVTLWVFTTGPGGGTPGAVPPVGFHRPPPPMLWLYSMASFLAAVLFLMLLTQQKYTRNVRRLAVLIPATALLVAELTVAGCGGGGSSSSASTFTPAGTFQVLVTATSGTTVRTTIVTVQVQ